MTHEEFMAQSTASIQQTINDGSSWFANRRSKRAMEDSQAHVDHLNKMQRNHDTEMERMTQASNDRIASYQHAANDQITAARTPSFEDSVDDSFDGGQVEEPGSEEGQMAQELVNRMD